MIRRTAAAALAAVVLSGCTPLSPGFPGSSEPPATTSSPSPRPSTEPSPEAPVTLDEELPLSFPVTGQVVDSAKEIVDELHRVAGHQPVLKLDVTTDQVTLSVLTPDHQVASYRWAADEINRVESDIEYLEQATFHPDDFPLESTARMFDVADLRGVRGQAILQVVDYRENQVLMTITSRPESTTVFFLPDGTAVAELGYTSVADITAGLEDVIDDATEAYAVGFNPTRGYWADLPDEDEPGIVLNRSRTGGLPVFETRRSESPTVETFDPQHVHPATLARLIAQFQTDPASECDVLIDRSTQRSGAVVRVECDGEVHHADLEGRDMTALITGD